MVRLSPSRRNFDFPKEKGFQTRSAIYVPSTKDMSNPVSPKEFQRRTKEVKLFLNRRFGGSTTDKVVGSFTSSKGKLINEPVTVVEHFTDFKKWKNYDKEVQKFLLKKQKEWGQESIGFEFQSAKKPRRFLFVAPSRRKLKEIA